MEEIKLFFYLYFSLVVLGTFYFLVSNEKGAFVYALQDFHSPFLDTIMRHVTNFGAFPMAIAIVIFIAIYHRKMLPFIGACFIVEWAVVDILKKYIYRYPRPSLFLENSQDLQYAEGVKVLCCNSFPSGHSALAFLSVTLMLFTISNRYIQVILLSIALFVAVSRVYLVQHFLEDIIVGSLIGVLTPCLVYFLWKSWITAKESLV